MIKGVRWMQCQPPFLTLSLGKSGGFPIWNVVVALLHICESEDKHRRWRDLEKDIVKGDRKQKSLARNKAVHGVRAVATISLFVIFVFAFLRRLYSGHTCVFPHRTGLWYKVVSSRQKQSVSIISISLSKPEVWGQKTKSAMTCNAASHRLSPIIYFS